MKFTVLLLTIIMVSLSCKKTQNSCSEEKLTAAFIFDAPEIVDVGVSFNLNVNYVVDNSCGNEIKFDAQKYDNTIEVKLKTIYVGCDCNDGFENRNANYPIIFDSPGVYELKFWMADNEYDLYTVFAE